MARDEHTEPDSEQRHDRFVTIEDEKPEGYDGGCLRPLGLCELGGCCDICWYGRQVRHDDDESTNQ